MVSMRTDLAIKNNSNIRSKQAVAKPRQEQAGIKDGFTRSVDTEMPSKPVFKDEPDMKTWESIAALGTSGPGTQSAIASAGGPLFKSLAGAIAKKLINDEQEEAIGQMLAKQIESSMPMSKDPEMNARVQNLGKKIAANSTRPNLNWSFKVIEEDSINAFAGPGGKVYVHSGLLKRFPKDDHVAFIIGHEAGHVENRDSIDKLGLNFVLTIAMAVLGKTPGKLDDVLGAAVGKLYDAQVSQKAEYRADRHGAMHMKKLGFDPKEGAQALRKLESAGHKDPSLLEKMFASHPPTEKRAQRVEKFATRL